MFRICVQKHIYGHLQTKLPYLNHPISTWAIWCWKRYESEFSTHRPGHLGPVRSPVLGFGLARLGKDSWYDMIYTSLVFFQLRENRDFSISSFLLSNYRSRDFIGQLDGGEVVGGEVRRVSILVHSAHQELVARGMDLFHLQLCIHF